MQFDGCFDIVTSPTNQVDLVPFVYLHVSGGRSPLTQELPNDIAMELYSILPTCFGRTEPQNPGTTDK